MDAWRIRAHLDARLNPPTAVDQTAPAAPFAEADGSWLERASDLLAEPDPGPTPFLVDELIVEGAIAAIVAPYKAAKTWTVLELAVAVVTGRDAFNAYPIPQPGPVIVVVEESGRAALHRRLDRLSRGYALPPDALRELRFAANHGVRLNDPGWQERLLAACRSIGPRAVFLDPLVRLKGATVEENAQREMGPVLDYMRTLRDESGAAVVYAHHTGHEGTRQRGTSDLEGYWESKLEITKPVQGEPKRQVTVSHREAESGHTFSFRLDFDETTRSLRLPVVEDLLRARVHAYLDEHPDASKNEVNKHVEGRKETIRRSPRRGSPRVEQPPARSPSAATWERRSVRLPCRRRR